MCALVRARVSACVCVRAGVSTRAQACAFARVASLSQRTTRMRHIVTSFVAPLAPPYLSTLSHKRRDFRKKVMEHEMSVLIFSRNVIWKSSHSKMNSATFCHKCKNVFV